jgi:hypothetical protein
MNDNGLYNSRIIKKFVEHLGVHYPAPNVHPVLDNSAISIRRSNDDPVASYEVPHLRRC